MQGEPTVAFPRQCRTLLYMVWLQNNQTDVRTFFYSKNYTREMLSPSTYSHARFLHRTMRIFHCWKQCCSSSSESLFMSSVTFAFTASTDSNLVPFYADLIFGNKKSHMGLGQVSMVDVPTQ